MSHEYKYDRKRMRELVRDQGRRSRVRRKRVTEGMQTSLTPRRCPMCGSEKVIRRVKGTFQYDGFSCLDCNAHFYVEGER